MAQCHVDIVNPQSSSCDKTLHILAINLKRMVEILESSTEVTCFEVFNSCCYTTETKIPDIKKPTNYEM